MRKQIKARMNWHTIQQIGHTLEVRDLRKLLVHRGVVVLLKLCGTPDN